MGDEKVKKILLAHGGGGRLSHNLIANTILPRFNNDKLAQLGDSALLELGCSSVYFTTDNFVVKPLFFNGGDIGKLAVCGTVNDLAVAGAKPVALSLSLIIAEGFEFDLLDKILGSVADTARSAGVEIVTGDTKVVEAGAADGIFINTAGVGVKINGTDISCGRIEPGDKIIINGTIGDHGMTIISQREGMKFDSPLQSDCACLNGLVSRLTEEFASEIKFMRDPTRGGLSATLNEIASSSGYGVEIREADIPVGRTVRAAADMLGFDLLEIANEGKVVMIVSEDSAEQIIEICKSDPLGGDSAIIGRMTDAGDGDAVVEQITKIGGRRVVQMPYGRELPRIC